MNIGHSTAALDLLREGLPALLAFQAAPPRLPAPGQFEHWLFERPLTTAAALLTLGLVLLVAFNRRDQLRLGLIAAGACVAVGAAVFAAGTFVTTDRERILRGSERFVAAAGAGDAPGVEALLSDRMTVRVGGSTTTLGREWVLDSVRLIGSSLRFDRVELRSAQGVTEGADAGRTQFRVITNAPGVGQAITWWRLSWRRGGDGTWRIEELDVLLINGMRPDGAGSLRLDRFGG